MCGLIACIQHVNKNPKLGDAKDFVATQLERQFSRGRKGFGMIEIGKNNFKVHRATEAERSFTMLNNAKENIVLFHHRTPTSTENTHQQTHPIFVRNEELKYDWYIMHNGVIQNEDELRKIHEKELGYIYTTLVSNSATMGYSFWEKFNDSEAFAIELARHLEGKDDKIKTRGSMAYIAFAIDKKTQKPARIFWGSNGRNPIKYDDMNGIDQIMIASELPYGSDLKDAEEKKTANGCMIEITDIFKPLKKETIMLLELVKDYPVIFEKEIPKVETTNHSSWKMGTTEKERNVVNVIKKEAIEETKETRNIYDGTDYENQRPMTDREECFQRMADKKTDYITEMINEFYQDITDNDFALEEKIRTLCGDIQDLLIEHMVIADRARKHFDKKEQDIELLEGYGMSPKDVEGAVSYNEDINELIKEDWEKDMEAGLREDIEDEETQLTMDKIEENMAAGKPQTIPFMGRNVPLIGAGISGIKSPFGPNDWDDFD